MLGYLHSPSFCSGGGITLTAGVGVLVKQTAKNPNDGSQEINDLFHMGSTKRET